MPDKKAGSDMLSNKQKPVADLTLKPRRLKSIDRPEKEISMMLAFLYKRMAEVIYVHVRKRLRWSTSLVFLFSITLRKIATAERIDKILTCMFHATFSIFI